MQHQTPEGESAKGKGVARELAPVEGETENTNGAESQTASGEATNPTDVTASGTGGKTASTGRI